MSTEESPVTPEAEEVPGDDDLQTGSGPNTTRKAGKVLVGGCALMVVGVALVATLFVGFARSADKAEYSDETLVVGPHEEYLLEIEAEEGRYDWTVTANGSFDGYQITDEHFSAYKAGEDVPQAAKVENVRAWTPFLQTGGGMKGLVIINNGDEELRVRVGTEFRRNPPWSVICVLPSLGLLSLAAGVITIIIGIVLMIRRK